MRLPARYESLAQIGREAGTVRLRAHDSELGRTVEVRVLHEPAALEAFLHEMRLTSQLEHPRIPKVLESGRTADGRPYWTTEVLRGRTLAEIAGTAPLAPLQLAPLLLAACDAVAFVHSRGVVHGDLTPERIAVGEFGQVLVTGWGRASRVEDGADPAVDVRALEAILARLAPRWRPAPGRSVIELRNALERGVAQAVWPASARVAVGALLALLALAALALWKLSS